MGAAAFRTLMAAALCAAPSFAAEQGVSLRASYRQAQASALASIDDDESRYQFVEQSSWYLCRSRAGEVGRNSVPLERLRKHRKGDCADFTGASLEDSDLKGAGFDGADLNHARLARSVLKGAHLHWADEIGRAHV